MSEWQPIETAPRDESDPHLLLWDPIAGDVVIGYRWVDEWVSTHAEHIEPTHWRPLPDPPEVTNV